MDRLELWDDTMLIVWTDHGFLLGEHDQWAKVQMPWYRETANTPFFVWDPRCSARDERRASLVQPSIDLGPTLLDLFGMEPTGDMLGAPLGETIATDAPPREAAIYGIHGGHVNVTDGRYVYMRAAANADNIPLYNYTLMPTHMRDMFPAAEFAGLELVEPFSFTKDCSLMRTACLKPPPEIAFRPLLFDLEQDPWQRTPVDEVTQEERLSAIMRELMEECDAPAEQYERLGL